MSVTLVHQQYTMPSLNSALQVLLNDDITQHIFYSLHDDRQRVEAAEFPDPTTPDQRTYRRSCYALSLVCKSLKEIGLDALWRDLYYLVDLLKLLPSFQCLDPTVKFSDRRLYTISTPVHPRDWARLQSYANRVKRLQMVYDLGLLQVDVFSFLQKMCAHKPLFPNLLDLRVSNYFLQNELLLFIPPTLRHVKFSDFQGRRPDFAGPRDIRDETLVLDSLSRSPMEIQTLSIEKHILSPQAITSIAKLKHLRVLKLAYLTQNSSDYKQLLTSLSGMPYLHTVYLNIDLAVVMDFPSTLSIQLKSLKTLTIHGRVPYINRLLRLMVTPHLRSLSAFGRHGAEPLATIRECAEAIAERMDPIAEDVKIWFYIWDRQSPLPEPPSFSLLDFLQPLFTVRRLRSLGFCVTPTPLMLPFREEDVEVMAKAWPHIQRLLLDDPNPNLKARPSLQALLSLARHCPELRELNIPLDCQPVDLPVGNLPVHGLSQLRLDMFSATPQTDDQTEDVARYVHALFPRLDVDSMMANPSLARGRWYSVLKSLQHKTIDLERRRRAS